MMFDVDAQVWTGFPIASAEDIRATALQRRFDRKYVLTERQFRCAVAAAHGTYKLLTAAGQPLAQYRTLYFDTDDLELFRQHARGQRPRFKVRIRHYPDRELSFVEIKQKTNKGETIKQRLQIPFGQDTLLEEQRAFVRDFCPVSPDRLKPVVATLFARLTLLSPQLSERVTSDLHLTYEARGARRTIGRVVIAEVKQGQASARSPFVAALRAATVRPQSFSKYSVGVALSGIADRVNAFVPTLKMIERLVHA